MNTISVFSGASETSFAFSEKNITFALVKNADGMEITMVNATEMAKVFGKTPKDWLRTNASQSFISSLSAVRHICPTELVVISQGGNDEQGTWVPTADYANRAWFEIKQEELDNGRIIYHRKITGLGRDALVAMAQEQGRVSIYPPPPSCCGVTKTTKGGSQEPPLLRIEGFRVVELIRLTGSNLLF